MCISSKCEHWLFCSYQLGRKNEVSDCNKYSYACKIAKKLLVKRLFILIL